VRTEQVSQQDRRHLFKDGLQFSHKYGMDDHALDYTMLYASCHSNDDAEKCTRGGRP
jgi:hypothetical protein